VTEYAAVHRLHERARLFAFLQENGGFFSGAGNSSAAAFLYSGILTRKTVQDSSPIYSANLTKIREVLMMQLDNSADHFGNMIKPWHH
jgi:hypothetical protein